MANSGTNIVIPGYVTSLIAGFVTLFFSAVLTFLLFKFQHVSEPWGIAVKEVAMVGASWLLAIHYIRGLLMIISAFMIKHEDHSLAGSIMILVVSILNLFIFAGALVGPILGIAGGVLGLKEHLRLIKEGYIGS